MNKHYQYYKVPSSRQEYKGVRFFRFRFGDQHVLQICRAVGEIKKGKSNTFGVYLIDNMTFVSNYFGMGYVIPCTKREFDKNFDLVVKIFKNEPPVVRKRKKKKS